LRASTAAVFSAAVLLAAVALSAAAAVLAVEPSPAPPLRNDAVVRLLVAGAPASEVIAKIRSAETAFDLSDEMKQELRLAGVPNAVLSAMSARQAEVDRARAPAKPPDAAATAPPAEGKAALVVTVRFAPGSGAAADLVFPARLDEAAAKALQVGPSRDDREVTDLAVFLACRTQDHVPDQWRIKSPLGRDFVSVPRHQILDFKPGASRVPASKAPPGFKLPSPPGGRPPGPEPEVLVLKFPIELRADVEPGIVHDLIVGVAVRVGERFLEIAEARKDGVVVAAEGLSLTAVLAESREKGAARLEVKFEPATETGPVAR
jgi:hypothetical protein